VALTTEQLQQTRARIRQMRAGVPLSPVSAQAVRQKVFRVLFGGKSDDASPPTT
jgi:hypothetical protein